MDESHVSELELLKLKFPEFSCICELCDCGRHVHHTNCKKMGKLRPSTKGEFPLSHNQDIFRAHTNIRPRSSKRPPPSARDPNPPSMTFETQQRSEFVPKPVQPHRSYDHPKENYEKLTGAMESTTHYKQTYSAPPLAHAAGVGVKTIASNPYYQASSAKFDDRTTAKETFKDWKAPRSIRFQELPSFTGSLLYPDNGPVPLSTMRQSYSGAYQPKPQAAKAAPNNLKTGEGAHNFETTSHEVYRGTAGDRAEKVIHTHHLTLQAARKGLLSFETQSMADYNAKKAPKIRSYDPAKPTIQIAFDERQSFETEQRSIYKGHDATVNPVPKSFKRIAEAYKKPEVPIDGTTVTHKDFDQKPLEEEKVPVQKQKKPFSISHDAPKFDDRTMNKDFFKNWGPSIPHRVRHGDSYEAHSYVPSQDKFEGLTTTAQTYVPKMPVATHSFKPVSNPVSLEGRHDFITVNQETYKKQPIQLCKSQLYRLQQDLIKNFRESQALKQDALAQAVVAFD